ncbi:MAG TPA: DUF3240 family protein [Gammaproteobacteria bacterium]|nr:DUF3240 family protein [Gammaproteobacteria bacterium]
MIETENEKALARLTLVFPPALEDRVVQLFLEQDPPLPGFTVLAAEGHGSDFSWASVREQVRGRVARKLLIVVLSQARAGSLIAALRSELANTASTWWLEPVIAFGRLA